MQKKI